MAIEFVRASNHVIACGSGSSIDDTFSSGGTIVLGFL